MAVPPARPGQTSKYAVSRVSKPAGHSAGEPAGKPAIQPVWKPALRKSGKSALNRYGAGWGLRRRLRPWRGELPEGELTVPTVLMREDLTIGANFCQGIVEEKAELRIQNAEWGDFATDLRGDFVWLHGSRRGAEIAARPAATKFELPQENAKVAKKKSHKLFILNYL